jgi:hypothetical protein
MGGAGGTSRGCESRAIDLIVTTIAAETDGEGHSGQRETQPSTLTE